MIPYLDHCFAEKALNFVYNFNISTEVTNCEKNRGTTKDGKKYIVVEVLMKFTFYDQLTDREIVREVASSHKGFENPATNEGDVTKSAMSKAWTVVARTFGIGSNLAEKERKAYDRINNLKDEKPEVKEEPVDKDFGVSKKPNY